MYDNFGPEFVNIEWTEMFLGFYRDNAGERPFISQQQQFKLQLMTQNTKDITNQIIEAITDKKGKKITLIDLSDIESAPTGQLVICQGGSTAQVGAIADSIRDGVQRATGIKPVNYDGYRNCQWIVIDYGNVMVHVFLPDIRQFYSLETLWNDAPVREIPDLD